MACELPRNHRRQRVGWRLGGEEGEVPASVERNSPFPENVRRGLLCQTLPLLDSQSSVAHGCGGLGVLSCKNCVNTAMLRKSSANMGNNYIMKSEMG